MIYICSRDLTEKTARLIGAQLIDGSSTRWLVDKHIEPIKVDICDKEQALCHILRWLNIETEYNVVINEERIRLSMTYTFEFENADEAMRFKLRWKK